MPMYTQDFYSNHTKSDKYSHYGEHNNYLKYNKLKLEFI